jgi:hypothetical protein
VQNIRKSGTGAKKSHHNFATFFQRVKTILDIKHRLLWTGGPGLSNS